MANKLSAKIGLDTEGVTQGVSSVRQTLRGLGDQLRSITQQMSSMGSEATRSIDRMNTAASQIEQALSFDVENGGGIELIRQSVIGLGRELANLRADSVGQTILPNVEELRTQLQDITHNWQTMSNANSTASATITSNTISLQRKLGGMQRELISLTHEYREMSQAERESADGQKLLQKMGRLREKAAELKDTIGDVKGEIRSMASDTSGLDAFNQILGVGTNSLSVMANTFALVTGEEEAFHDAILAFTSAQSIANTLTSISNSLQSSSIAMLTVARVKELAAATAIQIKSAAEGRGILITRAATIAQRAFNAAANANPYVLLASAIIAAGAAMYGLISYFRDGEQAAEGQSDSIRQLNEQLRENAVQAREAETKFNALQQIWQNTRGEQAKISLLQTYANQLKAAGLEVRSLQDAERLFATQGISNFSNYIRNKMRLQQAEAKMNKYVHDLVMNQMQAEQIQRRVMANGGKGTIEDLENLKKYNEQIKLNEKGIAAQAHNMGVYGKEMQKYAKNLPLSDNQTSTTKASKTKNKSSKSSSNSTKQLDAVTGQYESKIEELKQKLLTTSDTNERLRINLDIEMNEQKIEAIKTEMEILELKAKQAMGILVSGDEISKLESKINDLENYFGSLGDKGKESFEKVENAAKNLGSVMVRNIKPIPLQTVLEMPKIDEEKIKQIGNEVANKTLENYQKQVEEQENQKKSIDELGDSFAGLGQQINQMAGENTVAGDAMIAMSRMLVVAKNAEALASAIASAASTPWPANIPAIASAVAAVTSMFAAIPKFAQGGIFTGGSSYVGDRNLARLNKGEMILNTTQQSRLWRVLDSPMMTTPTTTSGNVEFRIQGQQLVGLLKNYNSKQSKIK